jgi:hypothetical protein
MWKKVVMAQFKILSQHLPGGADEHCKKPVWIASLQDEIRTRDS